MATLQEYRDIRIEKLKKLRKLGINPYPSRSYKDTDIADILGDYDSYEGKEVSIAGRIVAIRSHGQVAFIDIKDESGRLQLYLRPEGFREVNREDGELEFSEINLLDVGDFLEGNGIVSKTRTGEISLEVYNVRILSKSLRPLPDSWEGLKDTETRFRKRYLDLLLNDSVRKKLDIRWKMTSEIRKFLEKEGFVEVETPVLQPLYGGTNARPFITHFNALDCDFYLRVAPELYLKRLVVGGYEKVFEIARNFRNEGIDQSHFPEFTMLEWYEAYADYHRVMDLAESLTKHLVKEVLGGTTLKVNEMEIDISGKWPRRTVDEIVKEYLGVDWEKVSEDEVKKLQKEHKVEVRGIWTKNKALFSLFDHLVTPKLVGPVWVVDYPREVSPLSKQHRSKEGRVERFEGYLGGIEIFDGWSEIISGLEQRERFESEQKNMKEGDAEAMPLDESFLEALEYGCPPLGGIGFGIDRLTMFLTNTWSMKEVVAFPILKPEDGISENELSAKKEVVGKTLNLSAEKDSVRKPSMQGFTREEAEELLKEHVADEYQLLHAKMVAKAMEGYAEEFKEDMDLWYITGLLHDLDYFEYPDEHPNKSLIWLTDLGYPQEVVDAVAAHAHSLTGVEPASKLSAYLLAVDELAGFLYAYSLMRPDGFEGMKSSSAKKKFKDKSFAAKVDRDEIRYGIEKAGVDFDAHVDFLIAVYNQMQELKKNA